MASTGGGPGARYFDLARDLARDLDIAYALAHALARDLDLARDLARAHALAYALAHALARDLAHDLALDLVRALEVVRVAGVPDSGRLIDLLANSRARSLDLVALLETEPTVLPGSVPVRPIVIAGRLVGQVVRLVPALHRCRYGEEFRSELAEIAQVGGRGAQIGYAVRLLVRVLVLRTALRGVPPEVPERVGPG